MLQQSHETVTDSEKRTPLVSIIITTYNCRDTIRPVLNAIEEQDYPFIEVNIKDGASSDGTLDILEEYKQASKYRVNILSEKDNGIYDAMNQGFELSTGDIIVFCSDKLVGHDAVSSIVETIRISGDKCIGAHADLVYSENGVPVRCWRMGNGRIRSGWLPGHPTMYLKRSVYEKYGLYKTDYRIAGDYELMVRVFKDNEDNLAYLPKVIVDMSYRGTSNATFKNYFMNMIEARRALKENNYRMPDLIIFRRFISFIPQFFKAKMIRNGENI